jgi:ribonucleoside-diphosphate reductase beta chain
MSVFLLDNGRKKHTDSLAFLDPKGGVTVQRFDTMKYPQFDRLTESQLGFFWRPGEVAILKDASDFRSLSDHEKHIFVSNLKRQIILDSVQGRAPTAAFSPVTSLPEIEAWISAWTFSESIHSRSYTHILRNVFPDPSEVFDTMMDIKEIVDCAKDISRYYDRLIEMSKWHELLGEGTHDIRTVGGGSKQVTVSEYELKKALWLALMSVNVLEGIRFYVSFACSWAFAEQKKMEGNAKIIKFICLSDDTEILTPTGFKFFKDLDKSNDKVAQYNEDGTIQFVLPERHIEQTFDGSSPMVGFSNTRGDFDMLVTPNHRVAYRDVGSQNIKMQSASEFNPSCIKEFPVSGKVIGGFKFTLSALDRFRIAVQADGHLESRMTGTISGFKSVAFTLAKKRKIDRLLALASELKFPHTTTVDADTGVAVIRVRYPQDLDISKNLEWVDLSEITWQYAQEFITESVKWDGHERSKSNVLYCTTEFGCVDKMQQIAVLSGWRSHLMVSEDNRKDSYKSYYRLSINKRTDAYNCGPKTTNKTTVNDYKGKVYCVTVPSGMIVVRRKGKPFVTGNCRDENLHLAATQTLLKLLPRDDPDYTTIAAECRGESLQLFRDAVSQEKEWANYLFKDGSMIGLNERLLADYVEWIADKRLTSIGLPALFDSKVANPLPWTQKWISGAEVQVAPQEVEQSQYIIGAVKKDVASDTFKGFSL